MRCKGSLVECKSHIAAYSNSRLDSLICQALAIPLKLKIGKLILKISFFGFLQDY